MIVLIHNYLRLAWRRISLTLKHMQIRMSNIRGRLIVVYMVIEYGKVHAFLYYSFT